jgi:hypothetical protein
LAADELNFFLREKGSVVRSSSSVENPTGSLLKVVPRCFESDLFSEWRKQWQMEERAAAVEFGKQGLQMVRAETLGTHPRLIRMIRELMCERLDESKPKLTLGVLGPRPDFCAPNCCLMPVPDSGQLGRTITFCHKVILAESWQFQSLPPASRSHEAFQ